MSKLRFAVLGTGFWSHYQIPPWLEVGGVELVAVYNRTVSKAHLVAQKFGVPRVYADPEELLQKEQLDFIDIITEVPAHAPLVNLAAQHKVPVICQKPMAPNYETARQMVTVCQEAGIPFFVHENYRWQKPIRELKKLVDEGHIGRLFRGRFQFMHALEPFVWDNQPLLGLLALPDWVALRADHWPLFVGIGVSGALGQHFITEAFRHAPAAVVAPFEYTALLWGVLLDLAIWGVLPGAVTLVGGAIVIGAGLYLLRREARSRATAR